MAFFADRAGLWRLKGVATGLDPSPNIRFLKSIVNLVVDLLFTGQFLRSRAMECSSHHIPITVSSRRRLARWLAGSQISDIEQELILATLSLTHGNRTVAARLLGVSVRTLRNKIAGYSSEGVTIPRHEQQERLMRASPRPKVFAKRGRGTD